MPSASAPASLRAASALPLHRQLPTVLDPHATGRETHTLTPPSAHEHRERGHPSRDRRQGTAPAHRTPLSRLSASMERPVPPRRPLAFFFFNERAPPEISPLPRHDPFPI